MEANFNPSVSSQLLSAPPQQSTVSNPVAQAATEALTSNVPNTAAPKILVKTIFLEDHEFCVPSVYAIGDLRTTIKKLSVNAEFYVKIRRCVNAVPLILSFDEAIAQANRSADLKMAIPESKREQEMATPALSYLFFKALSDKELPRAIFYEKAMRLCSLGSKNQIEATSILKAIKFNITLTDADFIDFKNYVLQFKNIGPNFIGMGFEISLTHNRIADACEFAFENLITNQTTSCMDKLNLIYCSNLEFHEPLVALLKLKLRCPTYNPYQKTLTKLIYQAAEITLLYNKKDYQKVLEAVDVCDQGLISGVYSDICLMRHYAMMKLRGPAVVEPILKQPEVQESALPAMYWLEKGDEEKAISAFMEYFEKTKKIPPVYLQELITTAPRFNIWSKCGNGNLYQNMLAVVTFRTNDKDSVWSHVNVDKWALWAACHVDVFTNDVLEEVRSLYKSCVSKDPANISTYRAMLLERLLLHHLEEEAKEIFDSLLESVETDQAIDHTFVNEILLMLRIPDNNSLTRPQLTLALAERFYKKIQNDQSLGIYIPQLVLQYRIEAAFRMVECHRKQHPNSIEALHQMGRLHIACGNDADALPYFDGVLAKDPGHLNTLFHKGYTLFKLSDYAAAISTWTTLLSVCNNATQKSHCLPHLFDCYLITGRYSEARTLAKKYARFIPVEKRAKLKERESLVHQSLNALSTVSPVSSAVPVTHPEPEVAQTQTQKKDEAAGAATHKPEIAKNKEQRIAPHLQRGINKAVILNKKDQIEHAMTRASDSCTFDWDIYGGRPKPAAIERPKLEKQIAIKKLTKSESDRLAAAISTLSMIKYYLNQEGSILKVDKLSPHHFLYPRTMGYNLMKFFEALAPTSKNASLVTEEFQQTIQTHILTTKLINRMRNTLRHEFLSVDFEKLKAFCHQLIQSTVAYNVEAYQKAVDHVTFQARTTLPAKQQITLEKEPDYRASALEELSEMERITNKITFADIVKDTFYLEGLKMSVCVVEECIKRLGYTSDPQIKELFYFGNRVAHEMLNPETYFNEDIPHVALSHIIQKTEWIKKRIVALK